MMAKIINTLLLVLLFSEQISYAQYNQTMLQRENLKGKVKTIEVSNGTSTIKVWFDISGKIIKKETQDNPNDDILIQDFLYNDTNQPISKKFYYSKTPDQVVPVLYEYKDNGDIEFNRSKFRFDDQGNCILITRQYGHDDAFKEMVYNDKNQLVEAFFHKGPVKMNIWKTNKEGRRSYEVTKWTDPEKTKHVSILYNEFGDVLEVTLLAADRYYEKLNIKGKVVYPRYDSKGNWLEQIWDNGYVNSYLSNYFGSISFDGVYETFLNGEHITRKIDYYR